MMYSVMLVDNEPIIPKGLMKLIDWRISSLSGLECCSRGVRGSHALHVP